MTASLNLAKVVRTDYQKNQVMESASVLGRIFFRIVKDEDSIS